jgi:hypothetical protein
LKLASGYVGLCQSWSRPARGARIETCLLTPESVCADWSRPARARGLKLLLPPNQYALIVAPRAGARIETVFKECSLVGKIFCCID